MERPILPTDPEAATISGDVRKRYAELPFTADWDYPIAIYNGDVFFCQEELEDYCSDHDVAPEDLALVICEATQLTPVSACDQWNDDMPDDHSYELPEEVLVAVDALNKVLGSVGPVSYRSGGKRIALCHGCLDPVRADGDRWCCDCSGEDD